MMTETVRSIRTNELATTTPTERRKTKLAIRSGWSQKEKEQRAIVASCRTAELAYLLFGEDGGCYPAAS
ncbi:hypothetical protein VN12_13905 [Pirellula sp. SH-Sr6A]|uniref:hypothetical protein n=1 Tax=Pirellula sp. SH-Sr6A TaxID=1632865 RepID=UPI00078DF822|nr:hypothetical protein [Pirellula sp. SH-Sr6A]AMV33216.1 hypothetical protein VN12_13905 [Pirellula sp. SH-Sr6A]